MFLYILKRILYFIPTFFVISIITFLLGQIAPGDPIELKLKGGLQSANQQSSEKLQTEKAYLEISEKYGRHLPPFYFSLSTSASPDSLYKIRKKSDRENLERLIAQYGNWNQISNYYYSVRKLEFAVMNVPNDTLSEATFEKRNNVRLACISLYQQFEDKSIVNQLETIKSLIASTNEVSSADSQKITYKPLAVLDPAYAEVEKAYESVKANATPFKNYIPAVHWFGLGNQYHRWMFGDKPWFGADTDVTKTSSGLLRLDFGKSFLDDRPVASIIKDSLRWTLLLNFIVLLIVYIVSIPLGVALATKMGSKFDRVMTLVLFLFYSLPIVWIGTLMITFFTSDYYGDIFNLFPPYGLGKIGDEFGTFEKVIDRAYHFVLPIICLTIGTFAYISRQMRGSMLSVIRQDYIRTAFAKGLAPKKVYWKHAFRNSLLPIITMFSGLLPAMIGGAVIVEFMFNIPGMGRVSYDAVVQRDYPVLFTILMFSAILTMLGNLLADILYSVVDPRISFTKKMG